MRYGEWHVKELRKNEFRFWAEDKKGVKWYLTKDCDGIPQCVKTPNPQCTADWFINPPVKSMFYFHSLPVCGHCSCRYHALEFQKSCSTVSLSKESNTKIFIRIVENVIFLKGPCDYSPMQGIF